eukprot:4011144-Pyramimonas_sp.AAC.1
MDTLPGVREAPWESNAEGNNNADGGSARDLNGGETSADQTDQTEGSGSRPGTSGTGTGVQVVLPPNGRYIRWSPVTHGPPRPSERAGYVSSREGGRLA